MLRILRRPKWIVAALVVVLLAALFVRLGVWQLDRLDQRRTENEIVKSHFEGPAATLEDLLDGAGSDLDSIAYRRAIAVGSFDPDHEILIRSQVALGQAGFHVITPFRTDRGTTVLINRGWVPLALDDVPVAQAPPPSGDVTIEGWVHLTQLKPAIGPVDPPGETTVFARVDIDRLQQVEPHDLAPVYLVEISDRNDEIPIAVHPPDFTDEGPHLSYAVQWFGFALVGLVGFYFLLRRGSGRPRRPQK